MYPNGKILKLYELTMKLFIPLYIAAINTGYVFEETFKLINVLKG